MPSIAVVKSSTLLDLVSKTTDAGVATDRTFGPEGFSLPGVAKWVDRSGGIPVGFPALTLSVRAPSNSGQVYRVQAKLVSPTLEPASASTSLRTKAYELTANLEFMLPNRSTREEREAFLSSLVGLLSTSIAASDGDPVEVTGSPIIPAVLDFEPSY